MSHESWPWVLLLLMGIKGHFSRRWHTWCWSFFLLCWQTLWRRPWSRGRRETPRTWHGNPEDFSITMLTNTYCLTCTGSRSKQKGSALLMNSERSWRRSWPTWSALCCIPPSCISLDSLLCWWMLVIAERDRNMVCMVRSLGLQCCLFKSCFTSRAVESESREKSKNWKKSDKIGSDFLSDFLAKMPICHKLP